MKSRQAGFSLLEIMIVILVLSVVGGLAGGVLITYFRVLDFEQDRQEIQLDLARVVDREVIRHIRPGDQIQTDNSIKGGIDDRIDYRLPIGGNRFFTLYYHNPAHSGLGTYNQPTYGLRRVQTTSLGASFTYGAGDILVRNLLPPPSFYVSVSPAAGNAVVMDMTIMKDSETYHLRHEVSVRNE